ncbi:MAG: hypothetical protein ACI8PQ_002842 [Planctomycetota bacterium]|jgi:hypothetical protein
MTIKTPVRFPLLWYFPTEMRRVVCDSVIRLRNLRELAHRSCRNALRPSLPVERSMNREELPNVVHRDEPYELAFPSYG